MIRSLSILIPLALLSGAAAAQDTYPNRAIRMIVPHAAGGPTDVVARLYAAKMTESLGQQVIVENRPGAGGSLGSEQAARMAPDGYTVLIGTGATHAVNKLVYKNLPYDPQRDFAPIAYMAKVPLILVRHPSLPGDTVPELIAHLKANPGKYAFGSSGNGTPNHLAGELLKSMGGGLDVAHIPYRGSGPAMNDLLAGQIAFMFDAMITAVPHVRSGKLKAVGVASLARSPAAPDVPTIVEAGLPGFEAATWNALFAPAGTPAPILERLARESNKAGSDPALRQRVIDLGLEVRTDTNPAMLAAHVTAELDKWRPLVDKLQIVAE